MIYFICSLYVEGKPIIDFFNLKRNSTYVNFQVFENDNIMLIISGTGKINSAIAVSYLLGNRNLNKNDVVVNVGISGAKNRKIGEAFLINKIKDNETKRAFYPDILVKHQFEEAMVCTYSHVVANEEIEDLCDMEASGFFIAASKFVGPHQIQSIKIVSDNLNGESVDKNIIEQIINKNMCKIHEYIESMNKCFYEKELITKEDINIMDIISNNLRFTKSQKIELKKKYISYKIRAGKSPNLKNFINIKVNIKNESKKQFERIIKELCK